MHVSSLTCLLSCILTVEVKVSELLKNTTQFVQDVERYTNFPPDVLQALLDYPLPNSNMEVHHNSCIHLRGSKELSKITHKKKWNHALFWESPPAESWFLPRIFSPSSSSYLNIFDCFHCHFCPWHFSYGTMQGFTFDKATVLLSSTL